MVPTQDVLLSAQLAPFPSVDYLPAGVVAVVLVALVVSLVLVSVRRRESD